MNLYQMSSRICNYLSTRVYNIIPEYSVLDSQVVFNIKVVGSAFPARYAMNNIRNFFQNNLRKGLKLAYNKIYIDNEDVETIYTLLKLQGNIE